MFKYFSANSTKRYIDVLDALVQQYNNKHHSTIKMTPVEASLKINENKVWRNLCPTNENRSIKPKFSVRDRVFIARKKAVFNKGYMPRWTEEVFIIASIQNTDPPTYKIKDNNDEEIKGTFYEQKLQKTTQEIFRLEKIIKIHGNKSLVKWLGYPDSANSWVVNKELVRLHEIVIVCKINSDKTNELVRDAIAGNNFTEKAPCKHAETMRRIVTE